MGISRADLTRDCLQQIRLWPGCESVEEIAILAEPRSGFSVHVVKYGSAKKRLADRAIGCIRREKLRRCHLKLE